MVDLTVTVLQTATELQALQKKFDEKLIGR